MWEMASISPNISENYIPIASDWKSSDWLLANTRLQKQILNNSSNPVHDARIHAMLCYRSPLSFQKKFDRSINEDAKIFNVEIYKKGMNVEKVVNKAKTTGEPPLMLAMSVFFAIKDAISSISNYQKIPDLDAPATPEKILLSIKKLKNIV